MPRPWSLTNIISNAIDEIVSRLLADAALSENDLQLSHLQPATSWIRIRTEVVDQNSVVVRIADNGLGIKADVLPRIFDPFFTTKPVGQGTGLGLSISYQIVVDKHGGQLRCHSVPGFGAEFVIELPIARHHGANIALASSSEKKAAL